MTQKNRLSAMRSRVRGRTVFLGFLGSVAATYALLLAYHFTVPPKAKANANLLEQCRLLCQELGLIPTGHVANDARAYLEIFKPWQLSDDLAAELSDSEFEPSPTQSHPLVGHTAPDFQLVDDRGNSHSLKQLLSDGPTVIVFYYGYGCSHCVAQLFAIDKDIRHFHELGANVVALSADSSQETADKFAKYGRFGFPTLSDSNNSVAQKYGTFVPAQTEKDEDLQHGTFIISKDGRVLWAYIGPTPFIDNKSLLFLLAKEQERLPTPASTNRADLLSTSRMRRAINQQEDLQ